MKKYSNILIIIVLVLLAGSGYFLYVRNRSENIKGAEKQAPSPTKLQEAEIFEDDPVFGQDDAPITIFVFSDFLCPFCAAYSGESTEMVQAMKSRDENWTPPLSGIIDNYVESGKVKVVWKDLPFHGEDSIRVHNSARCAHEQQKFWDYHNILFSKTSEGEKAFTDESLIQYASDLGLNIDQFTTCQQDQKYMTRLLELRDYGSSLGIEGTPTTIIKGQILSGAYPFTFFKDILGEETTQ